MVLVPFDKRVLVTSLKSDTIRSMLSQAVDTNLKWYQRRSQKLFRGQVSDEGFRIYRIIRGRNTYLPLIKGKLEPAGDGTRLILTFSLHPIAVVALAAFIVWVEVLAVTIEKRFNFVWLFIFIGFHCLMYMVGYLPEKKKAEDFFEKYLRGPDDA